MNDKGKTNVDLKKFYDPHRVYAAYDQRRDDANKVLVRIDGAEFERYIFNNSKAINSGQVVLFDLVGFNEKNLEMMLSLLGVEGPNRQKNKGLAGKLGFCGYLVLCNDAATITHKPEKASDIVLKNQQNFENKESVVHIYQRMAPFQVFQIGECEIVSEELDDRYAVLDLTPPSEEQRLNYVFRSDVEEILKEKGALVNENQLLVFWLGKPLDYKDLMKK